MESNPTLRYRPAATAGTWHLGMTCTPGSVYGKMCTDSQSSLGLSLACFMSFFNLLHNPLINSHFHHFLFSQRPLPFWFVSSLEL